MPEPEQKQLESNRKPPITARMMTESELNHLISCVHKAASDLSRAATLTRPPLCHSLQHIATVIEDSLRKAGL